MKSVHLSVTNDVLTDQRVNKMAQSLHRMGFRVFITGVRRSDSKPFDPDYARVNRLPMCFQKKFLFYAEYNIRLFFYLLFRRRDIYHSNDLDSLPANYLCARIRRKPLVYDAHEYFTGTAEVISRPPVHRVWKSLERFLLPRQDLMITVNQSMARLYREEYGVKPYVIRNLPRYKPPRGFIPADELSLPSHLDIILMQGTGINVDRGAEELLEAMRPEFGIRHALLLFIGSGDVVPKLKRMASTWDLGERVLFLDKMPPDELYEYTLHAKVGVSLDKDTNINHRYSLPNKLFDYIMAGVPQLCSSLPELVNIVKKYDTGLIAVNHEPAHIATCIQEMLSDKDRWKRWHTHSLEAARELCWEKEEKQVDAVYGRFISDSLPPSHLKVRAGNLPKRL